MSELAPPKPKNFSTNCAMLSKSNTIHIPPKKRMCIGQSAISFSKTQVLNEMQWLHQLMPQLLCGCGLRLMECLCLRVKDI